jgi:replication factor A1
MEDHEGVEIDKAVEIPQPVKKIEEVKTAPSTAHTTKVKEPEPVLHTPKPVATLPASLANSNYMPIKALNTFTRDWMIKARVANRSELRPTQKGSYLLKIELVDSYGTAIEGTFFGDQAKNFDPMIQKNKIYCFSNGLVKMANKKFTSIKNDFCIIFEKFSQIVEAPDDGSITNQAFDFSKIIEITEIMPMKSIDVCGVITYLGEKDSVNVKATGQSKPRRQITLADDSMKAISITLWGDELCNRNDFAAGDVLAIKAARVSEFGGRSLNCSGDTSSLYRCAELRQEAEAQRVI